MVSKALLLAGAAMLFQAAPANAAVLNIEVAGTCIADCANVGLADGAGLGGSILADNAFYTPGGFSGNEALNSYSFSFGNFSFTSADPPDPGFSIWWGSTPDSVARLFINGFTSSDPARPGPLLFLDGTFGGPSFASHDGYLREIPDCCTEISFGQAAQLSIDSIEVAPVPLPPGVVLLASGLAGLAGLRLRRRAGGIL